MDELLKKIKTDYRYNPQTGVFISNKTNRPVGSLHRKGHLKIFVKDRWYFAHRLAWLWIYGSIDKDLQIDHINGVKTDNRISNLRLVTAHVNQRNCGLQKNNTTGFRGVYKKLSKTGRERFVAWIKVCGHVKILGTFDTAQEAGERRKLAEIEYWGNDLTKNIPTSVV